MNRSLTAPAPAALATLGTAVTVAAAAAVATQGPARLAGLALLGLMALTAAIVYLPSEVLFTAVLMSLPVSDLRLGPSPLGVSSLLALLLLLRLLVEARPLNIPRSRLLLLWGLAPLLTLPSYLLGPATPAQRLSHLTPVLLFFFVGFVSCELLTPRTWRLVRNALAVELIVALAIATFELTTRAWLIPLPAPTNVEVEFFGDVFRPRGIFISPYTLALFLALSLPFIWEAALTSFPTSRRRAFLLLGLSAWTLSLLVATLSRKATISLGVAAVTFVLLSFTDASFRRWRVPFVLALVILFSFSFYANRDAIAVRLDSSTSTATVVERQHTISDAVELGVEHPLFGNGVANFEATWRDRYRQELRAFNSFAEEFSDSGLFGLVAVILALGLPLIAAWRSRNVAAPPAIAAFSALVGLVAYSLVESSAYIEYTAVIVGLCLAAYVNSLRAEGTSRELLRGADDSAPSP